MGLLDDFVTKYRANRKVLLLIVYVGTLPGQHAADDLPIIPEYLLRISHPNQTDELLHDKIPELHKGTRGRRDLDWDDDDWDNTWDNPMPAPSPTAAKMPSWTNRQKSKQRPQSVARGPGGSQRSRMKPAYTTTTPAFEEEDDEDYDRDKYVAEVKQRRHETLSEENVHVGLMFGSKALIQLIANPMIGPWTNKIGYTIPMFTGFVIMFLSTLLFAFGASYSTLWMARMGMLAQAYPDDAERGSAMGIALGGLALGVLVGPPYGGVLYEWAGKELPFVLLALLALLGRNPPISRAAATSRSAANPEGAGLKAVGQRPAGSITIGNLGIAMLEPSLPLWMMESWGASSIERGAAFLPASISYLIGTNIFGPLAHRIGRWLSGFIGLVIIGFCLLAIPSAGSVGGLIIPNFFMGFSIGMIDASMFPMMGYIVDLRHVGVYGSIYAIADAAFCFAFALGPFFSGPLVRTVGFPAMMYLIALVNFLYAPLMFFLRKLPDTLPEKPADANRNAAAPLQATIQNGSTTVIETINPAHYQSISGIADPTIAARTGPDYQYAWDD
ncbi:Cat-1 [Aphelenchoides fujianensis]|nr:Cat-1 [Aphelenchoides fujianensis]